MEQTETASVQKTELSDRALCEACSVSRQTTRHWRVDGLPYKKRGKNIVYDLDATRKWMRDRIVHMILTERGNPLLKRLELQVDGLVRGPKAAMLDMVRNVMDKVDNIDDRTETELETVRNAINDAQQFVFSTYADGLIQEFASDVQSVFNDYLFISEDQKNEIVPDALYVSEKVIRTLYPDSLTLKD